MATTFGTPSFESEPVNDSDMIVSFGQPDFNLPDTETFGKPTFQSETSVPAEPTYSDYPELPETLDAPLQAPSSGYTPSSSPEIVTSTFDGKPLYIRRRTKVSHAARDALEARSHQRINNLLDVPYSKLLDTLSRNKALEMEQDELNELQAPRATEDTLWCDRYRPQRFTDLTGNERVAREAMGWVKLWDFCVFGKRRGKKRTRDDEEENAYDDEYKRPREKLLLLSGPPGLGKTTLAHVVAKHAGYDVMEINASDARSGHEVEDRIKPALESGSSVGSKKPVLLVLDEIDGASGSGDNASTFISRLLQLVQDKPRKKRRAGQPPDPKRPILRPIICVCNDPNAAALSKLRPHALHVRFNRPADVHAVTRLREICDIEGLKSDSRALNALVGIAKGDLRGCLNTLQYIRSRHDAVTEGIVRGATAGMKENEASLMSTLNSIFNPLSKRRSKELAMTEEEETRYVSRLVKEIETTGKEQALAVACFSQYITRRQHDSQFKRFEQACEWLTTFDMMSSHMYSDGDFAIMAYLPYTLAPFHHLFQERGASIVERNSDDWDNLQTTRANEEIYKSLVQCIRTASSSNGGDFRNFVTTPNLQLEFAPYLNRIISPPLRPINQQVVRAGEREILTRLVRLMSGLDLRFLQERTEDGALTYRLDPPIDVFVTYDGKRASDIAVSRYAFRHMVACEIDAKLGTGRPDLVNLASPSKGKWSGKASASEENGRPAKKVRMEATDKMAVDFFGRPITTKPVENKAGSDAAMKVLRKEGKFHVAYKFLEGNSAAVRRPIKLESFL